MIFSPEQSQQGTPLGPGTLGLMANQEGPMEKSPSNLKGTKGLGTGLQSPVLKIEQLGMGAMVPCLRLKPSSFKLSSCVDIFG